MQILMSYKKLKVSFPRYPQKFKSHTIWSLILLNKPFSSDNIIYTQNPIYSPVVSIASTVSTVGSCSVTVFTFSSAVKASTTGPVD